MSDVFLKELALGVVEKRFTAEYVKDGIVLYKLCNDEYVLYDFIKCSEEDFKMLKFLITNECMKLKQYVS
jgi:hypothetical protein